MPDGRRRLPVCLLLLALLVAPAAADDAERPTVDFDRQIRPILSDFCYACHGPDDQSREADLRLDQRDGVFRQQDGVRIVAPGKPDASELLRRLSSSDADEQMPPPDFPRRPTADQMDLIRQWIEQGAEWQPHWSFIAPTRPPLPNVTRSEWVRNPIDTFVLHRLEQEGLSPAETASRETLIRRVTLDLTGLPPTPEEVDAFCADTAPDAYGRLVDRLLASPAFGERMAIDWLDSARYADTSGYQNDGPRSMWRWRDWVIDAFNRNQPFDQFTIEQIAGDLLPNATTAQRVATGFQRNHRGNAEGGIVPEEFAVEYVVDRVETTATVWLGLTMGCARCHDHKYDPVRQRDFYQLYAFFNNIPEFGRAIKQGNSPPFIAAPPEQQQQRADALAQDLAAATQRWHALSDELTAAEQAWQASFRASGPIHWLQGRGLEAHFDANSPSSDPTSGTSGQAAASFVGGDALYCDDGAMGSGLRLDGQRYVQWADVGAFGYFDRYTLAAWVRPAVPNGTIVSRMNDAPQAEGYSLMLADGRLQLNLVNRWLDDAVRVETVDPLPTGEWIHVAATYDGSRKASGIQLFVNGQPQALRVNLDFINQTFASTEPFRIGAGHGPAGRFQGDIDEVQVYKRVLSIDEVAILAVRDSVDEILAVPNEQRTPPQRKKVSAYFLAQHAADSFRVAEATMIELAEKRRALVESFPTVMVMEEMSPPRPAFILARGQYDRPTEQVERDVPACLPPLGAELPRDRLGLARWLVSEEQPLTARVIVNRYWQLVFGTGLVKTAEDFGLQGERPSHPELLDWLAVEFQQSGWDLKRLLRLMVTSTTYQQSSGTTPEQWQRDPENRLLARGPRFRLSAELIRDQSLAAAGLLDRRLGGPSVRPYQPEGLWLEIATDTDYDQSHGADLFRRSLYTYWKRTVSPPTMATFDAPSRETCLVRRARTNTPLQALALMNETGHLEAARHLALRAMHDGGDETDARMVYMFRRLSARVPNEQERAVLRDVWQGFAARYEADAAAAAELLSVGETRVPEDATPPQLAAYTALASLLMNLDEVVTKE